MRKIIVLSLLLFAGLIKGFSQEKQGVSHGALRYGRGTHRQKLQFTTARFPF